MKKSKISKKKRDELFQEMYDQAHLSIKRLCYKIAFDPNDASDFYQECLIRLYNKVHLYDKNRGASMKTWGCTVSRNIICSTIEKEKLHTRHLMSVEDTGVYESIWAKNRTPDPEQLLLSGRDNKNNRLKIARIVMGSREAITRRRANPEVRDNTRKVFRKFFFYDKGYKEIAKELGMSCVNVRRKVCNLRKEIRTIETF